MLTWQAARRQSPWRRARRHWRWRRACSSRPRASCTLAAIHHRPAWSADAGSLKRVTLPSYWQYVHGQAWRLARATRHLEITSAFYCVRPNSVTGFLLDGWQRRKEKHLRRLIGKTLRPHTSPYDVLEQVIFQQLMKRSTYFLHSKSHLNKLSSTTYEKKIQMVVHS